MAPDRQGAELAFDLFIATYEAKYPKAELLSRVVYRGSRGVLFDP